MPRVFHQQYTKPIPAGAKPIQITLKKRGVTLKVPGVRFVGTDGRHVEAPLVLKGKGAGTHCRIRSETYYGRINGNVIALNGHTQDLAEKDLARRLLQTGPNADPFAAERAKPLEQHLKDFEIHLVSKGSCPQHVAQTINQIATFFKEVKTNRLSDLCLTRANLWLNSLREGESIVVPQGIDWFTLSETAELLKVKPESVRSLVARHSLPATGMGKKRRLPRETVCELVKRKSRGASPETVNHYVRAIRSFCRWLVFPGKRHPSNPLEGLQLLVTATDRRRDRRDISPEELSAILTATRASTKRFRGLTGEDRFHLYSLALATGFRASGLARLTPNCFQLDGQLPTVSLPASGNKSKKVKVQPVPLATAELMRSYLKDRVSDQPVWPGTWASRRVAAQMLRLDLKAAGVPYVIPTPDGPRYADFHSMRHTYLTMLGRQGVDLRTVQELAGHSTPVLTARYSHRNLQDLSAAVGRLPSLEPAYRFLTHTPDNSGASQSTHEKDRGDNQV